MIYFSLALCLILIVFLSFTTNELWLKHINARMVRVFLFPGTIVHELSHALLCLVTGTTIKELNLFAASSTGIKYDKPKVPVLFDFIIAAAPVFGCAVFIFFISRILSNPIHLDSSFPQDFHASIQGLFDLLRNLIDAVWTTFNTFRSRLHVQDVRHVLFLYAMIVFTVSMSPHKQDIKYLVLGFAILSVILFFLEKTGMNMLKYRWWNYCVKEFWIITTLTVSILATLLFVTLIVMGFAKAYHLTFKQKGSSKAAGKSPGKGTGKGSGG